MTEESPARERGDHARARPLDRARALVPILLVITSVLAFLSGESADPDLWGHIRFGEHHMESGALPQVDPYSYTAQGGRWINHEWLSELAFASCYRWLGDAGLLIAKLLIGLGVVFTWLLYGPGRRRLELPGAFVMTLCVSVMAPGFTLRPQLFSYLLFSVVLLLLHRYLARERSALIALPPLFALWANLHGGFLMGWALFTGVVVWTCVLRLARRADIAPLPPLVISYVAASAAVLVTPYGFELLTFLFQSLSVPRQVTEWQAVAPLELGYPRLLILALVFVAVRLGPPRRWSSWDQAAGVVLLVLSFAQQRHAPFFAMAAAPFIAPRLTQQLAALQHAVPRLSLSARARGLVSAAVLCAALYQGALGIGRLAEGGLRVVVDARRYPIDAVAFMKAQGAAGKLLLPMNWGEYAIWHLHETCEVSFDGRFRTVYPEEVIAHHAVSYFDWLGWTALIKRFPPELILAHNVDFFHHLDRDLADWVLVYQDPIAVVVARRTAGNNALISRREREGIATSQTPPVAYFP